jgi:hypothetical protein
MGSADALMTGLTHQKCALFFTQGQQCCESQPELWGVQQELKWGDRLRHQWAGGRKAGLTVPSMPWLLFPAPLSLSLKCPMETICLLCLFIQLIGGILMEHAQQGPTVGQALESWGHLIVIVAPPFMQLTVNWPDHKCLHN